MILSLKKLSRLALVVLAIIIVVSFSWLLMSPLNPIKKTFSLPRNDYDEDYGCIIAQSDRLFDDCEYLFSDGVSQVIALYSDGIRLYLRIKVDPLIYFIQQNRFKLVVKSDQPRIDSECDVIYRTEEEHVYIAVLNIIEKRVTQVDLEITDNNSVNAQAKGVKIPEVDVVTKSVDMFYEEIQLHQVTLGHTSTALEFDLFAWLDIDGFMIETGQGSYQGVIERRSENSFLVVFPAPVKSHEEAILHIIGEGQNVQASIPFQIP